MLRCFLTVAKIALKKVKKQVDRLACELLDSKVEKIRKEVTSMTEEAKDKEIKVKVE